MLILKSYILSIADVLNIIIIIRISFLIYNSYKVSTYQDFKTTHFRVNLNNLYVDNLSYVFRLLEL